MRVGRGAACLQTGDLHIQVAENSVMLGALFSGLTVYPQGAQPHQTAAWVSTWP